MDQAVNSFLDDKTILEIVRNLRNDLIKDFLDERNLLEYLRNRFNVHELSNVKLEFIRKALKELLIEPINVQHYGLLISQIRETGSASLGLGNDQLFMQELDKIFREFIYS